MMIAVAAPFSPAAADNAGHGWRRRCDHEQIGRLRQVFNSPDGWNTFDLGVARVDETN